MEKNKNNCKENNNSKWDWFKFIVGILFTLLIVYKLGVSNLSFDFSKFDFNTLLSLLLSLFAIWLSINFYHKATEASNNFYDNTYKFTSEISNILGRIEAGFGEKLQNLDKGYSGLVSNLERVKINIEEKKDLQKTIKTKESERDKIIQDLIGKAKLATNEKEEILQKLREREKEIVELNQDLNKLQNKIINQNNQRIEEIIPIRLLNFLRRRLQRTLDYDKFNWTTAQEFINDYVKNDKTLLYEDLLNHGLINDEKQITDKGYIIMKKIVEDLRI